MKHPWILQALLAREQQGQRRSLKDLGETKAPMIKLGGQELVNFSSNDYLGLSTHRDLLQRANEFAQTYGAGSTASRLVCGNLPCYGPVEAKLAKLKGTERALILNSGFQTNVGLVPALAGPGDVILMDKLIHNSLIQGVKLSGAKFQRFRHNDLEHLASLLEKSVPTARRVLVLAETVYSMDGDRPDLKKMIDLCHQHNAFLVLDEAHATGVLGPQGMGLSVGLGADLVMGTFGKGMGSFGAYLAGSSDLMDYMINFHPGLIYSTGLPPSVLGSIDAALDLVPQLEGSRQHITQISESLRSQLQQSGFDTLDSSTQIIPVVTGEEQPCLDLARYLQTRGFFTIPIRPPTVEPHKARIRLALNSQHTQTQIDQLAQAFAGWRRP